mmetsp:Transcript_69059/g.80495  ORF Transcript_69059/g.80495 Transcript_69059/m.80495 type:complete len:164 (-) Transcript_69059:98-589(-)|eukprot:CAMPEP_0176443228 /NCGR_PEP_ID=MMETSP0127-20121128/22300_1 /TAXON_ID=938130 /ORGANISM="Platyophrya macrostoma, Strain WH" /LENGTH=163 /DNA_ID=CAMNT_0017828421 /DNA_START=46 /DNA_END=537 /DNA_ORIENTATION=-
MYESSRLHPYIVPGYTGFIPTKEDQEGGEFNSGIKSHIPGYAGYIPGIKPENMFGKTYGKNTYLSKNEEYLKGFDVPPETRFKSLVQDSFVNQRDLTKTLVGPLSPTKMVPGYPTNEFYQPGNSNYVGGTDEKPEDLLRSTQTLKGKPTLELSLEDIKKAAKK